MKKIGEYSVRGQLTENESESLGGYRINLFDGRYDTGFKVTKFMIFAGDYVNSSAPDVCGKLATQQGLNTDPANFFNASDQREIGWAGHSGGLDIASPTMDGIVDRENLLIEDVYVYVRGVNDNGHVNYYIEFDKYELPDYRGSLAMVQNRSQG